MKLVAIDEKLIQKYKADKEILHKKGRPYVLVIRLKYKGNNQVREEGNVRLCFS